MDNWRLYLILVGCLVLGFASGSSIECNGIEEPNKFILCYANVSTSLPTHVDVCRCSHLVVPFAVNTLINASVTLDEELVAFLKASGSRNGGRLRRVLSLTMSTEDFSPISSAQSIATSLAGMIDDLLIEGVEIHWHQPSIDENSKKDKANLVLFMKELHAVLQEKIIVTSKTDATSDMNSTNVEENGAIDATRPLILLRLPTTPELLVKAFDLKPLARTADLFVVATHDMADANNVTYHHSRLMGLSDILNTDSVLDLVASLGVSSDRVVAAIPTFAVQFRLRDAHQNLPGSAIVGDPLHISKEQLCSLLSKGNWTVERDDDLTGTYAYSEDGDWIAFDDEIAAQIKAKYFLLRDVAGVAMMPANMDDKLTHGCNSNSTEPSIVQIYYDLFHYQESGERTRRQLANSLQEDVSSIATALSSPLYNERVKASPYRIVRIVSRSGESSVIRQPLESSLQCSRQGYYRHPEDCGRFYRCVKFDQYVDDFTVFEYDCPEGLVFDERYEVCTWPSQAAPCGGSSEIRPVPMNKFVCPGEGYFADPENCRWFFACRDYAKDGSPFTQYEFRCPFGLLFDEQNLICNWPWLVPQCSGASTVYAVGSTSNVDVVKSKPQQGSIAIGSPGYLSGKLVTGEGLYKDPRPAPYMEIVASTGCIDCQSAGLVVRDPSDETYPGSPNAKQAKLVLAIPAATIADQSTPVRIIVASPASSEQQYLVSTTPSSYVQKYSSTTTPAYNTGYGLSSHGPSGSHGSPANQRTYESSGSSQLSASSDMYAPYSPVYHGNEQTSGYPRGPTSVSASATAEQQGSYGKGVSDIYRSETWSKASGLPSAYSDPTGKYAAPTQGSGIYSPQTQHATVGYNTGAGLTGASSYLVQTGKDGAQVPDGSPGYSSGLGSEGERGQYDGYSGGGHAGSVNTAGSTSSYKATAQDASKDNSRYSQYQDGAPAYQVPTTEASYMPHKPEKSEYQAPAVAQKKPDSPYPIHVSTENVSGGFNGAPASASKTVVEAYKDTASYYEAPAPAYKATAPAYQAPAPSYQAPAPSYQAPAPSNQAPAPSYQAPAPSYHAPAPSYQAPAPSYQAPAPTYKAPAPAYEAPAPAYQAPAPAYQAPAPAYKAPAPAYQAPAPAYESSSPDYKAPASVYKTPAPSYEAPSSSYKSASPAYKAPASVYQAPEPAYKAPVYEVPSPVYKAPAPVYQPPAPAYETATLAYEAPAPAYQAPAPAYQAPAPAYQAPAPAYQAPAPAYQAPAPAYQAPAPAYQAPAPAYQAPAPAYQAPAPAYQAPAPAYQAPAPAYQAPAPAYHASAPEYQAPAPAYQAPAPAYQAPTPEYQAPAPAYQAPAPAYQAPAPVYQAPAPVYQAPAPVYQTPAPVYEASTPAYEASSSAIKSPAPVYETRVHVHGTTTAVKEASIPYYPATSTTPPSQAYEAADPSYKPLVSGYKTTASVHQTSFPIYDESTSVYKASVTVDQVSPPAYKSPTSVYTTPFSGTDTSNIRIHDEKTVVDKAKPSTYEKPAPAVKADTGSHYSVSAPIYEDPTPMELNKPYGPPTPRPSGPSAYDSQQADDKSKNGYSSTLTVPYVEAEETGDEQKPSYPANTVKNHAKGYDRKQNFASVAVHGYNEPTSKQTVSGAGVSAQQGKTNEATANTTPSYASNAESSKTQQVHQDYGNGYVKGETKVTTSSYSSGVALSVQQNGSEKSQGTSIKKTEWDIEDLFHRGSPSEKTTKAPSRRPTSSLTNAMRDVKQPMKAYQEMGKVSGSRLTGSAGETRGTGGTGGTRGTGGTYGTRGTGGVGGTRGSGGVDDTRRGGLGSRTQGSAGYKSASGLRDTTYGAPAAVSATRYNVAGHSTAWDGSSGGVHGKSNQNTNSPTSRYQDDYETSGQLGDHTFGLKEDVKTKNKYNASQLDVVQSRTASVRPKADSDANRRVSNGKISYAGSRIANGKSSSKQQDVSDAIGHVEYKGSDRGYDEQRKAEATSGVDYQTRQSQSDATTSRPVSIYRDKVSSPPTTDEVNTSYSDKKITVKVPSTNKAAILEKWTTASSSAFNTKTDSVGANRPAVGSESYAHAASVKPQSSVKDLKLNNRQGIKNRVNVKTENQRITVQSNGETSASTAITSSSGKKISSDGLGAITEIEYGNRYLEKITIAQATARNETLGSEVCVRAGLFRHPSDCQKFYECYWDRWIRQYTVHIFKCPVHLVYDDYITACNWPLDGPACVPHEAVKLYPELPSAA
ncbi:uncharacterized protein LOC130693540 [Daphnia carinata]|uniref:uncharacterized protein LOC130693540 n=1 Tax=Daphnia carinata TaxID=120202 RepID=UPI00257F7BFB|nr:uncharacterized protein LOC130693540 [Daphnia carinata]